MSKAKFTLPRKRKYKKGKRPCGRCLLNKHKDCRPRSDGTLCTCTCDKAQMLRDEVERKTQRAENEGKKVPSLESMVEIMCPRYKQIY